MLRFHQHQLVCPPLSTLYKILASNYSSYTTTHSWNPFYPQYICTLTPINPTLLHKDSSQQMLFIFTVYTKALAIFSSRHLLRATIYKKTLAYIVEEIVGEINCSSSLFSSMTREFFLSYFYHTCLFDCLCIKDTVGFKCGGGEH